MNFAVVSLAALACVFGVGFIKKNPFHLGVFAMVLTYLIGKAAGIEDAALMSFFPTTMLVRVFGIVFFFAICQTNGSVQLLATKMIAMVGCTARQMPFLLFYIGVILGSIGINSLAGMAILAQTGVSLAVASDNDPLLYGTAGGFGIACGCYSPINEYTANILSACEGAGLDVNLISIFLLNLLAYSLAFLAMYLVAGGLKSHGAVTLDIKQDIQPFTHEQKISLLGIIAIIGLVVVFQIDIGWAGMLVGIVCILFGAGRSEEAMKTVPYSSLFLVCGVGTLVNFTAEAGGFEVLSSLLTKVMVPMTAAPLMSLTASMLGVFTMSRLVVITLVPALPGILAAFPSLSPELMIAATCAGSFASSVLPLTLNGVLVTGSLSQQYGEDRVGSYYITQMVMGVVGTIMVAAVYFIYGLFI